MLKAIAHSYKLPFDYPAVFLKIIFLYKHLFPRMQVMLDFICIWTANNKQQVKITKQKMIVHDGNQTHTQHGPQLMKLAPYPHISQIWILVNKLLKVNVMPVNMYIHVYQYIIWT